MGVVGCGQLVGEKKNMVDFVLLGILDRHIDVPTCVNPRHLKLVFPIDHYNNRAFKVPF